MIFEPLVASAPTRRYRPWVRRGREIVPQCFSIRCSMELWSGRLWAIIEAESADQIRRRIPQVEVFDAPPPTLSAEAVARIRAQGVQSIDSHPMKGWLADLEP
jgi:hypothetical protein